MTSDLLTAPRATPETRSLAENLERDGIVVLPDLLSRDQLAQMQFAFAQRLQRQRWNNVDGYEKNERFRHMVNDVLTLDQGFVDVALHQVVKETLHAYIGPKYELVEAKGWKSLPTNSDFHGWHGDAWYDQTKVDFIPREVKLALYLTDVRSGHFSYVKGSHGKQVPRNVHASEVADVPPERIVHMLGNAGTAFLFDTSGIHRQSYPILEPRQAVFYNYHDPAIPLQAEDVAYDRYHPLLLNAAFLGGLSPEDMRVLGFGNKTNFIPGFVRASGHPYFHSLLQAAHGCNLFLGYWWERIAGRLKRLVGMK
jgi:Phytanoyl-CoA dioxygenase (PhyH)